MTAPEISGLVDRLVGIHGEGGICPAADDWRAILQFDLDRPIFILNLLRFRDEVQVSDRKIPGSEAYDQYAAGVAAAFLRAGGKQVFFGRVGHLFPIADGDVWDAAIVTRYPSPRALASFWLDDQFIEAHAHRVDGVERSRVLVFEDAASATYAASP